MKLLMFEGGSDDTFGEYNVFKDDHDNCANGKPIRFLVSSPTEGSVLVVGQYCPGPATGWQIGVARADEDDDTPLPPWPMRFTEGDRPYSPRLVIEAPDDATMKHVSGRGERA